MRQTRCAFVRSGRFFPLTRGAGAGQKGATPLHHAAFRGHLDTCEALHGAGSSIDIADSEGRTPFLLAAAQGQVAALQWLVANGANARARAKVCHQHKPRKSLCPLRWRGARVLTSVSMRRTAAPPSTWPP